MSSNGNTDRTQANAGVSVEQFAQLMSAVMNTVRSVAAPSAPTTTTSSSGHINWTLMPSLDLGRPGELDYWFIAFEGRLRAAQLPTVRWAEKFSRMPQSRRIDQNANPESPHPDYGLIRSTILQEHGPIDPVGYFEPGDVPRQRNFPGRSPRIVNAASDSLQSSGRGSRPRSSDGKNVMYPFLEAFLRRSPANWNSSSPSFRFSLNRSSTCSVSPLPGRSTPHRRLSTWCNPQLPRLDYDASAIEPPRNGRYPRRRP